jgi:hypothetical protein
MRRAILAVLPFLALLAGCDGAGMMQSGEHAALMQGIDDARAEVTRHHDAVMSAASMDAMRAEAARHRGAMGAIHDDMRLRLSHMGSCGHSPTRADMMGMMDGAMSMEADHAAAMAAAGGLEQARAECDRYVAGMARMHDDMAATCGDMSCM